MTTPAGMTSREHIAAPFRARRPTPPRARLPRTDRPFSLGFVVSVLVHVRVVAIVWGGSWVSTRLAMGEPGHPGGGGGGGGGVSVQYVELPPWAPPSSGRAVAVTPQPIEKEVVAEEEPELVLPETRVPDEAIMVAKTRDAADYGLIPVRATGAGQGEGAGPGAGTGSGGGIGSGQGTGIGSDVGPGTGGQGGDVFAPEPRSVVYPFEEPPGSVQGKTYTIHFWVDRRGRVTKVEITPRISDGAFRRKLEERMRQWVFYPARTLSGQPVAGELLVTYEP